MDSNLNNAVNTAQWSEAQIAGFRALLLVIALVKELSLLPLDGFLDEFERLGAIASEAKPGSFVAFHGSDTAVAIKQILREAVNLKNVFLRARALQEETLPLAGAQTWSRLRVWQCSFALESC